MFNALPKNPPVIADKWPNEGYFLPDEQVFLQRFSRAASIHTLERLLQNSTELK